MRYAVYFTPPPSDPLTRAAQAWLGRDAFTGESLPASGRGGLSAEAAAALTAEPRRYGFHATLVAPFRLIDTMTEAALLDAADAFCTRREAFELPPLGVSAIGSFFALCPSRRSAEIDALAAEAVDHFAPFRAPLDAAEIARRDLARLSSRQRDYLGRYGYPFVKEEFRFHMTLTGPVALHDADRVRMALDAHFRPVLGRPVAVDDFSIFVERGPGLPFTVLGTHSFARPQTAGAMRYA